MKRKALSIALIVGLIVGVVGCASTQQREPAEAVVRNALEAYKSFDVDKMHAYWEQDATDFGDDGDAEAAAMRMFLDGMTYEIVSSEESTNTAIVDVEITNTDMSAVLADVFAEIFPTLMAEAFIPEEEQMDEDEIGGLVIDTWLGLLRASDYPRVTNTVQLTLALVDDTWVISGDNDAVIDAMMGGVGSFADAVNEVFNDGPANDVG